MKASLQRKIMRWIHIVLSIPVIGYIYGPVAQIPRAAMMVKWVIFPFLVISGLWLGDISVPGYFRTLVVERSFGQKVVSCKIFHCSGKMIAMYFFRSLHFIYF